MSCKEIKTVHGNMVEVQDEFGAPLAIRFEDDDGKCRNVYLSCEDATKIARALDAFVTIHSP
jgi:hypothetical protein